MAKVKFPTAKPNTNSHGTTKRGIDGSMESQFSNIGGPKGAKVIGTPGNASSGKLKTYKTSVFSLNTGSYDANDNNARGLGEHDDQ